MNRLPAETLEVLSRICACAGLPKPTSHTISFSGDATRRYNASSFKIDSLAQGTIAAFNVAVATYHGTATQTAVPIVTLSPLAAALEFKSERMYTIDGKVQSTPNSIGGLYRTKDGHVRIHDGFEVHRQGARDILGLPATAGKADVANACAERSAEELEAAAFADHAIIYRLRKFDEWDASDQGKHVPSTPIQIKQLGPGSSSVPAIKPKASDGCLKGLRVLEFSRVIAAPVGGRALAAHGADVLWVTCPGLEDQPFLDRDFGRGKRSLRLDLNSPADLETVRELIRQADALIHGYRPGSLAKKGLGVEDVLKLNPKIIYGMMSAHPQAEGNPWRYNRGFDSMVQTCSGINSAESDRFNMGLESENQITGKALPCQALDHAAGFLLATGVTAALRKRHEQGGAYLVEVSLAATGKFLRSLGQFPGRQGFEGAQHVERYDGTVGTLREDGSDLFSERPSEFGVMNFLNHAGSIEGAKIGWKGMPSRLGSGEPEWLEPR